MVRKLILTACHVILATTAVTAENLPPGYSLFDKLFSKPGLDGYQYDIPYPFEKIIERLNGELFPQSGRSTQGLVSVMIPRGRSLQREAAKPDYYQFPRIVIALDREPDRPLLAKNRLFLGYQEKAQLIEVISYNEQAGRFEFQLIEDYAPGKTPSVHYANRRLCMSCHQNGATIFPRPLWRETNFNGDVAARIGEFHARYHGLETDAQAGDAGRFDLATDQANLLSAYQQVWQTGCDASASADKNRACRAALFLAALEDSLATVPRPVYQSLLLETSLQQLLKQNWERRWPEGMRVASADIDDRRAPLNDDIDSLPAQLDPISLRPPLTYWSYQSATFRSIKGLANQFILRQDILHLSDQLYQLALQQRLPQQNFVGECHIGIPESRVDNRWINIDCQFSNEAETRQIDVNGELYLQINGTIKRELSWLLISSETQSAKVEVSGKLDLTEQRKSQLNLLKPFQALPARLWDNQVISDFYLRIPHAGNDSNIAGAWFRLSDDLSLLQNGIAEMLSDADTGQSTLFDKAPIQGMALMRVLLSKLGVDVDRSLALDWPSGLTRNLPAASIDARQRERFANLPAGSSLRIFLRYCAACHRGKTPMPPGFLRGDLEQVQANLLQCAPRIAYRLAMWHRQAPTDSKSPMPPPASFRHSGVDLNWWRRSEDLRTLQGYIAGLISPAQAAGDQSYDALPACFNGQVDQSQLD